MEHRLSPQNEQYLEQIVAVGLYASKEAALNAAIVALREKTEEVPAVPAEHFDAVEAGLAEAEAGLCQPMTDDEWSQLRQRAHEIAAARRQGDR